VFRQKDNRFSTMLNEMRRGQMSDETVRTLQSLNRPPKVPDGISPTQLFPRRYEVDASNQAKLRQLSGKTITYTCDDQYANDE
jgi:ATP-dependent DNA helicase PIF1